MHLKNGKLASNAKENMSVFGMHFDKVLNNHRPVDRSVLNLLEQKPCMMVIDNPISFTEVKRAINKLKKGRAQSNGQCLTTNSPPSRMPPFSRVKLIMKGGIKASISQCLSEVT